jgi:four helix bundle protein
MKTELEGRTRDFAIATVKFVRTFPRTVDGIEVGRQLLRSACSIGANYREGNRAESKNDFIHKVGVAEKEASETAYWLEICQGSQLGTPDEACILLQEAGELLASITTIGRKAKGRSRVLSAAVAPTAGLAVLLFWPSAF